MPNKTIEDNGAVSAEFGSCITDRAKQMERLNWLHGKLQAGDYPVHDDLCSEFDVPLSLAYRDFDFLKYILKAPLQYDYKKKGHYYSEKFDLPDLKLTEGNLSAMLVLNQLRKSYGATEFGGVVDDAVDVLARDLGEFVTIDGDSLDQILQVDIEPFPQVDLTVFQSLLQAIRNNESIIIKYFSGQKAVVVDKPCDPYHLLNFKDNWYLVAFCHEKQDYRDFLCSRILEVEHSNVTFLPDPDFSLDEHKKESQLFAAEAPQIDIVVEFDKYAAHWIRLKKAHPSQKVVDRPDGSLELSFSVSSMENIMRWILSFGEHARVLAPSDLQERVRRAVNRMNYLYSRF